MAIIACAGVAIIGGVAAGVLDSGGKGNDGRLSGGVQILPDDSCRRGQGCWKRLERCQV